jgi:nicotinate-nucleotide--dimethylbenzimidazole phosphoribosyltransferase
VNGTVADGVASAPVPVPPDLTEIAAQVSAVDDDARELAVRAAPPGGGRLAELAGWLAAAQGAAPPHPPRRPRCVLVGSGVAPVSPMADILGVGVRHLDAETAGADALHVAIAAADAEVDAGTDLAVLVTGAGEDDPGPAAAVSVLRGLEPVALLPRGAAAVDSATWSRHAAAIRDTRRAAVRFRSRPDRLLAALGSPVLAAATGFLLRATARRTPIVLDGSVALAAALVTYDLAPLAADWWQVADTSGDPVQTRVCEELALQPLLDLGTARPDGTAGLLALPLLQAAAGTP